MIKALYVAFILTCVLILPSVAGTDTTGEKSDNAVVHEFGEGIVSLIVRSSVMDAKGNSLTMSDAKLRKLGNRYFVTGNLWVSEKVAPESRHQHGVAAGVNWEDVKMFYQFNNEEQIEEYIEGQQAQSE